MLSLALLGSGCSGSKTASTPTAPAQITAKQALPIAMSALATTAPDAKLLVGQSAQPITATSTPVWEFLLGSPKTDVVYAVIVMGGKGQAQEYGKAGLTADEWAKVPSVDAWKVDSDVAHQKAITVYSNGKNAAYVMGFVTYVPAKAKTPDSKPQIWVVNFDPASIGHATTSTVDVSMTTGAASLAK